jgi:glucuronokinase
MGRVHTRVVPARVGLVGNPSDGYGGAVVAAPVAAWSATVTVRPSDRVRIAGGGAPEQWPSWAAFVEQVSADGHHGPQRVLTAALARAVDHLGDPPPGVDLEWSTTVPRSVGLAGSSALAVGVIGATAEMWGHDLDPRVVAALALRAETHDLGIAAGWQDRIVQAFDAPVLVDTAAMERSSGVEVPAVRVLRPPAPVPLVIGWIVGAADESGTYHDEVRSRSGELAEPMAQLGTAARRAADILETGDLAAFADLVDRTWLIRRAAVPLRPDQAGLVESVRRLGVAATTPGSGGAVVAVPLDAAAGDAVAGELDRLGARVARSDISSPRS